MGIIYISLLLDFYFILNPILTIIILTFLLGDYFGELALLHDKPRAATVIANGRLKCVTLGKKAFTRLLGPVMDILKRNSENYHAILREATKDD